MSHYFSKENQDLKSDKKHIYVEINKVHFDFVTDHGVFSKAGLDFGTRCLLDSVITCPASRVLDLGSGYGPIGIIYKHFHPEAEVLMVDINPRATSLCAENAALNQVDVQVENRDGLSGLDEQFNLIITNPPIRAGKQTVYRLFEDAWQHLLETGALYFVMHKKHGVQSAIKKCQSLFRQVEVVKRQSGYHVIRCIK